ncbi:adenylate/guanylate cyclase domain-containing protein [Bradyrhizobium jicamae]|uniref:Adenylate/guanylate cyclase domain-containing protein n=1 Tax=Bradyrhizobium jicamae TaxID=280332 RepID=A0ABS5FMH9_9BRAD|nr:adenylate/guanylate cyclase domain-containing protein [Bradyrhizobium jicamae]MBR0797985.1 adenylate/guanylate cyclase domain-containing protein [Bradyrhizobium jicamae]
MSDPMTVSRRLVAVFAADVEGYSRLMGADEVGTLKGLTERRTILDRFIGEHGGRIANTAGDSVLAEFGSVVDAVECAVKAESALAKLNASIELDRRINYRIGVHVGDVMVRAGDLFGDGVNIAARLEGLAEPGGICISASAHEHVHGKVAVGFSDLGEHRLKNIVRPIRAFAVTPSNRSPAAPKSAVVPAPPLSILVLPFESMGGDAVPGHFADGLTESLTTDLLLIQGISVIARNTAFTFKGKAVDVKQVGRELSVRYVVEGSVQRGGSRLRLNVQLIEADTGKHIWAERFDKPVADLFDMQDEIVSRLANSLRYQLVAAEARRSEHALNPTSMDLYFQGWAHLNYRTTPDAVLKARECFERALVIDSRNIEALVGKASVHTIIGASIMGSDSTSHFAAAEAALTDALNRSPQHAIAHLSLGGLYIQTGRPIQGIAECEHALTLDRNLANAHALIGQAKGRLGRPEETEAHILEALRISPRDTYAFWWMFWAGSAKLTLEEFSTAASWFRRTIEENRNYAGSHVGLASALVQLGATEEAKAAMREALKLDPNSTITALQAKLPPVSAALQARRERYLESLRIAGMPEG